MAYKDKNKEKQWQIANRDRINKERRERYKNNPELFIERNKKYYWENRSKMRAANRKHKYGISHEHYTLLLEKQQNRCAICGKGRSEFKFDFSVDHCHETGKIRGLLCTNCNTGIGLFKHNTIYLNSAIEYLS